jgi:hypothetical protein
MDEKHYAIGCTCGRFELVAGAQAAKLARLGMAGPMLKGYV